jgi:hypothetical protein
MLQLMLIIVFHTSFIPYWSLFFHITDILPVTWKLTLFGPIQQTMCDVCESSSDFQSAVLGTSPKATSAALQVELAYGGTLWLIGHRTAHYTATFTTDHKQHATQQWDYSSRKYNNAKTTI